MYTSGTTGMPKGVMHSFGTFAWSAAVGPEAGAASIMGQNARMLSYLPLSHVAERTLVEHGCCHRHAGVLRREPGHLHRRPAARAAHGVLLGAAAVGQVPAGHPAKMPPAKLERLLKIPILGGIVRKKVLTALGLDQCTCSPPAAPRRCRPTCCAGTSASSA
jgi:long-chain acyl-CoA synthetase